MSNSSKQHSDEAKVAEVTTIAKTELDYGEVIVNSLEARGITDIEATDIKIARRSVIEFATSDGARQNAKDVMDKLGIPEDSEIVIVSGVLTFKEVVSGPQKEVFPNRQEMQSLRYYVLSQSGEAGGDTKTPIAVFSHGGSIRPETILKSPFLPLIQGVAEQNGSPLILVACDHRGSSSDEEKTQYNLEDRRADLEVLIAYMLKQGNTDLEQLGVGGWDQKTLTLIGNSMGGHVATLEAELIHPTRLILAQPAAYSIEAHYAPLGTEFSTQIRMPDSWKRSPAYDALERYLRGGGDALIIGAIDDEAVPSGITRRYMKEVTYAYMQRAVQTEGRNTFELGYMWIPETHTRTTPDEVLSIAKKSCNQ